MVENNSHKLSFDHQVYSVAHTCAYIYTYIYTCMHIMIWFLFCFGDGFFCKDLAILKLSVDQIGLELRDLPARET